MYSFIGPMSCLINTWRTNLRDVCRQWIDDHGIDCADEASKCPMTLVATRWGSLEATLKFLADRGRDKVSETIPKVFAGNKKMKTSKKDAGPLNLDAATETETHYDKMSRWKHVAITACNEKVWWAVILLLDVILEPLTHFFKKCAKLSGAAESKSDAASSASTIAERLSQQIILELATDGARTIRKEIYGLKAKLHDVCSLIVSSHGLAPGSLVDAFFTLAYDLWSFTASSFDRRIFSVITQQLAL